MINIGISSYTTAGGIMSQPKSTRIYLSATDENVENSTPSDSHANSDPELQPISGDKEKTDNAPKLNYLELFVKFLWFGMRAFGGPVAQINLMKTELVDEGKWITKERFNKVYAVYQMVPGPEAYELACYFGYISRSVFGALLGMSFSLKRIWFSLILTLHILFSRWSRFCITWCYLRTCHFLLLRYLWNRQSYCTSIISMCPSCCFRYDFPRGITRYIIILIPIIFSD